jgi:predicted transcriptional regulator
MGAVAGQKHSKKRKYTTPEERAALVAEYEAGGLQVELAAKFGITQVAVSKILARCGAKLRTACESQPPTFDVSEAARLWSVEQKTTYEVGVLLGVSQSVVAAHLKRRGVLRSKGRGVRYKFFDRKFF